MFSWFSWFTRRPKETWGLVKTFTNEVTQVVTKRDGKIYFHLFESNRGRRRVEFATTFDLDAEATESAAKRMPLYQEQIYRWEQGRFDPDIPRYSDVPLDDTANALKGKV